MVKPSVANEVPHAVRELDHVGEGNPDSFPMTPYAMQLPPGSFDIKLDPGKVVNGIHTPLPGRL